MNKDYEQTKQDKINDVMNLVMAAMDSASTRSSFSFQFAQIEAIREKLERVISED